MPPKKQTVVATILAAQTHTPIYNQSRPHTEPALLPLSERLLIFSQASCSTPMRKPNRRTCQFQQVATLITKFEETTNGSSQPPSSPGTLSVGGKDRYFERSLKQFNRGEITSIQRHSPLAKPNVDNDSGKENCDTDANDDEIHHQSFRHQQQNSWCSASHINHNHNHHNQSINTTGNRSAMFTGDHSKIALYLSNPHTQDASINDMATDSLLLTETSMNATSIGPVCSSRKLMIDAAAPQTNARNNLGRVSTPTNASASVMGVADPLARRLSMRARRLSRSSGVSSGLGLSFNDPSSVCHPESTGECTNSSHVATNGWCYDYSEDETTASSRADIVERRFALLVDELMDSSDTSVAANSFQMLFDRTFSGDADVENAVRQFVHIFSAVKTPF